MNRNTLRWTIGAVVLVALVALGTPPLAALTGVPVPPPSSWSLEQNDPNPFCSAGATAIRFAAPVVADVQLLVFSPDSTAVVRTLVNSQLAAGLHAVNWDGRDDLLQPLADGRYPYVLLAVEVDTHAPLFVASKAATIFCPSGVERQTWGAVKSLYE
jgi:hypothetical protein